MRIRTTAVALAVVASSLLCLGLSACRPTGSADATPQSATNAARPAEAEGVDAEADARLAARFEELCEGAGGEVGVAVTHVETGRSVEFRGATPLPLFSVFKLPLVVAVLRDVEENRLRLDQKVRVTPAEVAPGSRGNTELWRKPSERTIAELLELSIVRSDNTSSDKMLQLVGGPAVVTERMRALGLRNIEVRFSVKEFLARRENNNTGTASDLAGLLARLRRGEALRPPQLTLLLDLMGRATTGERRLRGDLPAGTPVADKTGTGETATNDVGLITLPGGRGHLAMAVLVSGSKLSVEKQEKLIAQLARAAYDSFVARPQPAATR